MNQCGLSRHLILNLDSLPKMFTDLKANSVGFGCCAGRMQMRSDLCTNMGGGVPIDIINALVDICEQESMAS